MDIEVAIAGAGVVGSACALALARRGVDVALLEAEPEPGLGASGTNSGIVHTGFDSVPGELETELILRSAELRAGVLEMLGVPTVRCGAVMRALEPAQREPIAELARNAEANGIETRLADDGSLEVPGEFVCDPVAYTLGLAAAAQRHRAELRTRFRVASVDRSGERFSVRSNGGDAVGCRVLVNCAGLYADEVAREAGDDSFEIYPRKGEFLVFDPPGGDPLDRILLPVPSESTKGVLVFPTVDGRVIAGPTAVDGTDKRDWSVRPEAREEIVPKVVAMLPALEGSEPIFAYAGLRPAGRGVNYLIGHSEAAPRLINVAAIRSTGLTASLGIAEYVCTLVAELGVELAEETPLEAGPPAPAEAGWWRRTADLHA